ncbi:MAG: hypothetical protein DA330_01320 [Nitrososphaera sp.]|nr:hypothetical protein [Nitrososphaera sp.]
MAKRKNSGGKDDSGSTSLSLAADSVKGRIHSISVAGEERVTLEDNFNSISRETEYMLDRIGDFAKPSQKKILIAYREYLEKNLDNVNNRLKELDRP